MISSPLLQIVSDQQEEMLSPFLREQLQGLYDLVPSVTCSCDRMGQCCELTQAEIVDDFATMYPLYYVEYLNIVDFVQANFDGEHREYLLGLKEEWPERCPFLTDQGGCSIYPVRPLACRTYGVLSLRLVEEKAKESKGNLPPTWIRNFLSSELFTVCSKTRILEPEKVASHADAMITFAYERDLNRMGTEVGELAKVPRQALHQVSGLLRVTRWTWGGFNALIRSSEDWLELNFPRYWKRAFLRE